MIYSLDLDAKGMKNLKLTKEVFSTLFVNQNANILQLIISIYIFESSGVFSAGLNQNSPTCLLKLIFLDSVNNCLMLSLLIMILHNRITKTEAMNINNLTRF